MLNPDGVIVGNYRTNLAARDLNRTYKDPKKVIINIIEKILLSCPHTFSYKGTREKLLKYQENSPWAIISIILMIAGVE